MKAVEAFERIKAEVENALPLFQSIAVTVTAENEICDARLNAVNDISKAKNISSTLVVDAEGLSEDDKYCLYLGLDVKRGEVDGEKLEKTVAEFKRTVEEVKSVLAESKNTTETLLKLGKEAEEEFDRVMKNIRKSNTVSGIAAALVGIGVLILFIVATLS